MELSDKDRKVLWGRACNTCSFPQCSQKLTQDQVDAGTGEPFQTVIGEEAHIYSASAKGPRYDPFYPAAKLETYDNRILLCRNHHKLIDSEKGRAYDPETLTKMKRQHEDQQGRRKHISSTIRAYIADQYEADDKVLFRQVKLEGPKVDTMFVDVPFAARRGPGATRELLERIAADQPGDADSEPGYVVTGAAQALMHPDWSGNALVVGGPGQGKSTLLQYICQFHRARYSGRADYTGEAQGLQKITEVARIPIRLDLRAYGQWATSPKVPASKAKRSGRRTERSEEDWRSLETFIAHHVGKHSGGHRFDLRDVSALVATEAVLLAFDGLDEVANLDLRDRIATEIVRATARLRSVAIDLVVVVTTRPGLSESPLWSSVDFPVFHLQRLTASLRLQYLQRWCRVAELSEEAARKLQETFLMHESLPHIRDLASYPMQLAILLHLLHRRGLLPQERTELYSEYLKAFLDREETEDKEPLLSSQRDVIEDIHAFLGWHLQKQAETGEGAGQIAQDDLRRLLNEHLADQEKGQELAKQLFSALVSRVLCLVAREPGIFQFEVQSLREYFAAAYINEYADPRGIGNSKADCLDALLERPYWLNTCRFLVGMFTKIEIRGLKQSLNSVRAKPELKLHPHLRSTAGRLLDDRTYQGQPAATVQEVVDFVLEDAGVIFAEDGLLDESGQPLTFAEDAGRSQATRTLKSRLQNETAAGVRSAIARMLCRHADHDELTRWWWDQFEATSEWLQTAADLRVLDPPSVRLAADLASAVEGDSPETHWASEVLAAGSYAGGNDRVLKTCIEEINDGAGDVLTLPPDTPLGKFVEAAHVAQFRPTAAGSNGPHSWTPPRRSHELLTGTEQIRTRPSPTADSASWASRIEYVSRLWGDGWVLRQAIALVPASIDVAEAARAVATKDPALARLLEHEADARSNRGNTEWWRAARVNAVTELQQRVWLFSILTSARTSVVIALAPEINAAAARLTPRHYRAMEVALQAFKHCSRFQAITPQEALRRNQVTYSARVLWLIRSLATAGSVEQIDKKLTTDFEELLEPGMGDRRSLIRIVGAARTIKINSLRGTRNQLPTGAWAGDIKLGAMTAAAAKQILEHPEDWPVEIVGRAVQYASIPLSRLPAITEIATKNRWFETATYR